MEFCKLNKNIPGQHGGYLFKGMHIDPQSLPAEVEGVRVHCISALAIELTSACSSDI